MLKIAVPNKGRLSESTLDLFQKAGLKLEAGPERKLYALALDRTVQVLFLRAQDIPEFVQDGVAHLGVTGEDIVQESGKAVKEVLDLQFGYCRLVVAVPDGSLIREPAAIADGARIATSFPNLTRRYFDQLGKKVRIVEVSGATELTPHIGVADLVTDLTSSGSTLAMNGLREVATIVHSTARVVAARGKRYLMANVPKSKLDDVRRLLPGISGPTIMDILSHPELVAAHAVVDESAMLSIVNGLKALGATGILVLPIERLVP